MAETSAGGPDARPKKKQRGWYASVGHFFAVQLIGVYHLAVALLLVYLLYALWPVTGDSSTAWSAEFAVFGREAVKLSDDARLMLIVLATGALGSYVHSATSFVSYVGNRRLRLSWAWWYLLRPLIGLALALIFYFVIRGGLLSTTANPEELSVYGVAAVAGLVGMFSKQATDKLREVFDTMFRTQAGGDKARADKLADNILVTNVMIARYKIVARELEKDQTDADVKVVDLHARLVGIVTRIPVLIHNGAVKYVIHQSIIYKFITDKSIEAAKAGSQFQADSYTLADLAAHEGVRELIADTLAFVSETASVWDARKAMNEIERCQDVFVTEHGLADEPMKGWLTNADLVRQGRE